MTRSLWSIVLGCILVALPLLAGAQVDKIGKPDTLVAEIGKIDAMHWTITVSLTNDEYLLGLSVPLKMTAGLNRVVADSAVFIGGRIANFAIRAFRADTAIQCVLLGAVASVGGPRARLDPGTGRLATIFVSSLDKKPIEKLAVDTTTMHPSNSLMVIADSVQGTPPDTTVITDQKTMQIVPAFVVKFAQ